MSDATTPDEILGIPLIRQHLGLAAAFTAKRHHRAFIENIDAAFSTGDFSGCAGVVDQIAADEMPSRSPLEAIFLVWWLAFLESDWRAAGHLRLVPQAKPYLRRPLRLDFAISPRRPCYEALWSPIGVELDGHAFHEKTRQQVTSRNRRDRELIAAGWRLFHFSYDEFTHDPELCVGEVLKFALAQLDDVENEYKWSDEYQATSREVGR